MDNLKLNCTKVKKQNCSTMAAVWGFNGAYLNTFECCPYVLTPLISFLVLGKMQIKVN